MKFPQCLKIPRKADFAIGDPEAPYLRRWWIIPRNRFFNIYLHQILKSDDDRALHDHPWFNMSIVLKGGYWEHTPNGKIWRNPASIVLRRPTTSHRLELATKLALVDGGNVLSTHPCWTLFITGPRVRNWGFLCPKGWVHWRDFIGVKEGEATGAERGPGCGENDEPQKWRINLEAKKGRSGEIYPCARCGKDILPTHGLEMLASLKDGANYYHYPHC